MIRMFMKSIIASGGEKKLTTLPLHYNFSENNESLFKELQFFFLTP